MKLKSKYILLLIAILGIFSLENCKKQPEEQIYMGDYPLCDIKDYLFFKPGSLWVYECDSTLELDSQVMISIDTPWLKEPYITYQLISYRKQSLNEGTTYTSFETAGGINYNQKFNYFYSILTKTANSKTNSYTTNCVFFKPFDSNQLGGGGSAPTKYLGLRTNFKVLDKTYDTVRVFQPQFGGGFPEPSQPTVKSGQTTLYYAKGVGLVRIHVWTRKKGSLEAFRFNWNLKSYLLK